MLAGRQHRRREDPPDDNTLVLRNNLSGEPSFEELLGQVKEKALTAYAHQDLPFEKLVEDLQPERDLAHSPLFQVLFQLQNVPRESLDLPGLEISPLPWEAATSIFDLSLLLHETDQGLEGWWRYNSDLFDHTTVLRFTDHYRTLLAGAVAAPSRPLTELPLLSAGARHQLRWEWNDIGSRVRRVETVLPQTVLPQTVLEWFEPWVEATPEAVAVVFGDQGAGQPPRNLTYTELDARAGRLSERLRRRGVRCGDRVGLCVRRSLEMAVGLLGILKARAAYVPLDPTYPPARLAFMLEESGRRCS